MARYPLIIKLVAVTIALTFLCLAQPIEAASPSTSDTSASSQAPVRDNSADYGDVQVTVQFTKEEITTIEGALPEGDARQIFNKKISKVEEDDELFSTESVRAGEEFAVLLYDGEKAFSRVQEQFVSFFTKPGSTIDTR